MENEFLSDSLEELSPIEFHAEDIDFELEDTAKVAAWLSDIISTEGMQLQHISCIFCSDAHLVNLNIQYLQHDTLTDIITFPYARPPIIEGDIFISIDRIEENAETYYSSFEAELHRVMAHGVLHLCGYSDKTDADKAQMTAKENDALANWSNFPAQKP